MVPSLLLVVVMNVACGATTVVGADEPQPSAVGPTPRAPPESLAATTNPEVVLVDAGGRTRHERRIDDRYKQRPL